MQLLIIGVTFFLGVGIVIVGAVAIFRRGKSGGGTIELPLIKLTADSAAGLLLVVGAAMILSGFAWASTDRARGDAVVARDTAVTEKDEVVKETVQLHDNYVKQAELVRLLAARVPPAAMNEIPANQRILIKAPLVQLSPRIKADIGKSRVR